MPERGPDGKFLPKDGQPENDVATAPDVSDSQVDERIAVLEAELDAANEKIAELSPSASVAQFNFNSPEDVVAHFGTKALDEKVRHEIAIENKKRTRDGFDRIVYDDELFAEKRAEFIAGLLADRANSQPPHEGWLDRTLKMIKPNGVLVQIPYEGQINNVAGSLADGYVRYERKNYKRTVPLLCPSKDCWNDSLEDGKGGFTFSGYCSEDHFNRTEKGQVDGLTA